METIRVLLAEDQTIVRKGLRSLLERESGIEVVAEAEDGRQAVRTAKRMQPDVVLMDYSMPGLNGLEATRQIKERSPNVKVLVLTRHTNQEYIKPILKAGASGYLLKKTGSAELVVAIQSVHRGDAFLDPAISEAVIEGFLQDSEALIDVLTPREREVLQLVAEGHTNRDIASILHISVKTVGNHRANFMRKLDLHSTADVTQYAIRMGIISLDN